MFAGRSKRVEISTLRTDAAAFERELQSIKQACCPDPGFWYPYGTLNNWIMLDQLLQGEHRYILDVAMGQPIADIGAADGDLAFFLEQRHHASVQIIDHAPTNFNSLRGARLLKEALSSNVQIHDIDLDEYPGGLPELSYGLVFFLGILYHLKNPFHVLETLATHSRHCLLSTRIAKFAPRRDIEFSGLPIAYLLDAMESNNDPTNYWIFTAAGLKRILNRSGWDVMGFRTFGDLASSDPFSQEHDERAFCLLRSRHTLSESRKSTSISPQVLSDKEIFRPETDRTVTVDTVKLEIKGARGWSSREELLERYWACHPRFRFFKSVPFASKLLDVGAGDGGLVYWKGWANPKRHDVEIYAVDRNKGALFDQYVDYRLCDLDHESILFDSKSFDAIMASLVLEFLEDPVQLIGRFAALLKTNGILYVETCTPGSLTLPPRQAFEIHGLNISAINSSIEGTQLRPFPLGELCGMIETAGLEVVENGLIERKDIDDDLLSYGTRHRDVELTTYAIWSKLSIAQYLIARLR
jgi:tRNA (mo5U34)-methyltransferase